MSNNGSDVEDSCMVIREGEMNISGQRLYSEAFDVFLQPSSHIITDKEAPEATSITKGSTTPVHQRNVMQPRSSATKNTEENKDPNEQRERRNATHYPRDRAQKKRMKATREAMAPRSNGRKSSQENKDPNTKRKQMTLLAAFCKLLPFTLCTVA